MEQEGGFFSGISTRAHSVDPMGSPKGCPHGKNNTIIVLRTKTRRSLLFMIRFLWLKRLKICNRICQKFESSKGFIEKLKI